MSKPNKIVSINTKKDRTAAFDRIMKGVDLLADSVKQTLGPAGHNFLLEKSGGRITNDGITIAREIQAEDEIEDLGLRIVREAAIKTNEDAGDGTTTATTLAQAILQKCSQYMPKGSQIATKTAMQIKRQIDEETQRIIAELKEMSTPVKTKEDLINVAKVSAEDEQMAQLIGEAQWEMGKGGVIIPEENPEPVCNIERIHGVRIDNGLGTSMVMNDPEKQRLTVDNVPVLLTNRTIDSLTPIASVLQELVTAGERNIVIVSRAFSSEAIREIMENHQRGVMIYPMNAPFVNQREVMKDLEAILGGRYIHDEDSTLESVTVQDFGRAQKVIGYRYSAIFTGTQDKAIAERVEVLKKELKGTPSKYEIRALEERIAQMENGFALFKIGSTSDAERKYKFDKAEDAVNAVRHALQEGTVPGAGIALKLISEKMSADSLMKEPILAPYNQIRENAGGTLEVEDWVKNATKVERLALENAARIAGTLVTTGGAVAVERDRPIDQLLKKND